MSSTYRAVKRSVGSLLASTVVLASIVALPISMAMPVQANAVELKIAAAMQAGEDLAITKRPLEQVEAPSRYSDTEEKASQAVTAERQELQAADGTISATTEELSLARALVSSSTAIVGVTFPRENAEQHVTVSYRQRTGHEWSEWIPMELAQPGLEALQAGTAVQGTEPIPLVDIDEVEAKVSTADGKSIPGVVLNVIEPELTPQNLESAQEAKHGADEVRAAESILSEPAPEAHKPQASNDEVVESFEEGPQVGDKTGESPRPGLVSDEELTPAEEAEENAQMIVPVGTSGGQRGSTLAPVRATGLSTDGRSYVTDIPGLTITTRKGWGANESVMDWDPEPVTFKGAVIHHTAGSNNYSKSQVPNVVRGVYHYHAVTLGWGDVGYHLLVDKFGGVWEGRAGGLTRAIEGGHAYGANTATFGISVLGDYMRVRPSDEAIDAVAKAVAWKLRVHNIRSIDGTITVKGNHWGKSSVKIPIIAAHREVGGSDCPGDAFMKRMPEIKAKAAEYMKENPRTPTPPVEPEPKGAVEVQVRWATTKRIGNGWPREMHYAGAFSRSGNTDAFLIDSRGDLWLYPSNNYGERFADRIKVGHGWNGMEQVFTGTDFDGDRIPDIIGRHKDGRLIHYAGNGQNGFKHVKVIGWGWNNFNSLHLMPEFDNGKPLVYAVSKDGHLRAYFTDGRGSFTGSAVIGNGWGSMRSINAVRDTNGDGRSDMLAIDKQGDMWLYRGLGHGKLDAAAKAGFGWRDIVTLRNIPSTNYMWAVHKNGDLLRYHVLGVN